MLEKLLCHSRSLWRRAWQDRVSQHNTRPARPKPRPQRARPRQIFSSRTGRPKTKGLRPHHWQFHWRWWIDDDGVEAVKANRTEHVVKSRDQTDITLKLQWCRSMNWQFILLNVQNWGTHPTLLGFGINNYYAPAPRVRGIKRWCTSDICLLRTSGLSREQRPRKTKIGTEATHVTRDSDTTFKVKRSTCRERGILWRPPTQLVMNVYVQNTCHNRHHSRVHRTYSLYLFGSTLSLVRKRTFKITLNNRSQTT